MWAHSTCDGGARSPANCHFLTGLLHHRSLAAPPDIAVSVREERGITCINLAFRVPQVYRLTGVTSIPILIPTPCVGTGFYEPADVFNSLVEEIAKLLAGVRPQNTLFQLYRQSRGQPLVPFSSPHWQLLHHDFLMFIDGLRRQPHSSFSGLGQLSGTLGVIEVMQARTSTGHISADYITELTLSDGRKMSLDLPRSVALLGKDWLLDWLEAGIVFSNRV